MHWMKAPTGRLGFAIAVVIVWSIVAATGYGLAVPDAAWLPKALYLLLVAYAAWWSHGPRTRRASERPMSTLTRHRVNTTAAGQTPRKESANVAA